MIFMLVLISKNYVVHTCLRFTNFQIPIANSTAAGENSICLLIDLFTNVSLRFRIFPDTHSELAKFYLSNLLIDLFSDVLGLHKMIR